MNPISKLIDRINNHYDKVVKDNYDKVKYADRNKEEVIVPFLAGLGAEFLLYEQVLLVKESVQLREKLESLKFVNSNGLQVGKAVCLYQKEFGIEINLVQDTNWALAKLATTLVQTLKIHDDKKVLTFFSLYRALLKELGGTECT